MNYKFISLALKPIQYFLTILITIINLNIANYFPGNRITKK